MKLYYIKSLNEELPAERIIGSWINAGGGLRHAIHKQMFKNWLIEIGVSEKDSGEICKSIDIPGKMELQDSAKNFITSENKNKARKDWMERKG